jgi:hypothetical protein
MSVSPIIQIVREGFVTGLATFLVGGAPYILWNAPVGSANQRCLYWKLHDGTDASEVQCSEPSVYTELSAILRSDGALLVVHSDGTRLWATAFDLVTGMAVMPRRFVVNGKSPALFGLDPAFPWRIQLAYVDGQGNVFTADTPDDGATWRVAKSILTNYVAATEGASAAFFDSAHVSLIQAGQDARRLTEIGVYTRTRPLAGIMDHPTLPDRYYVLEAAQRAVAAVNQLSDVRGTICEPANDGLLKLATRVRQGADDGVGDLVLLDTSGLTPTPVASTTLPAGATPGTGIVTLAVEPPTPLSPSAAFDNLFPGTNATLADTDCVPGFVYAVGYTDQSFDGGGVALRLSDGARTVLFTGKRGYAVATDGLIIAVAYEDTAGQYRLGIGPVAPGGNYLTPAWNQAVHRLPARPNCLVVIADGPVTPDKANLYVGLADRVNLYRLDGFTRPIRLVGSALVLTRGAHRQCIVTPRGNLACAMGAGGVAVFSPNWETLAELTVSGFAAPFWASGSTATLNTSFVQPNVTSGYSGVRRYFKCTQSGVTGSVEPAWGSSGTVIDNTARWIEVADTSGIVTGIALDAARQRIYAVGVAGGVNGTAGRVWVLNAQGGLL